MQLLIVILCIYIKQKHATRLSAPQNQFHKDPTHHFLTVETNFVLNRCKKKYLRLCVVPEVSLNLINDLYKA